MNAHDSGEMDADRPPTVRHDVRVSDDAPSSGDPELIAAVDAHIAAMVGKPSFVFHEIESPYVHVDVHCVPATLDRTFQVLVTSGMSERPMVTPAEMEEYRHAELLVCLPAEWPLSAESIKDERWYWPIRLLKALARLPHEYATWLGMAHTVPNGDPPEPYASSTRLCGAMIVPPLLLPEEVRVLNATDGRKVHFWSVMPLYEEELAYRLAHGTDALFDLLDAAEASDLIEPERPTVVRVPGSG